MGESERESERERERASGENGITWRLIRFDIGNLL